MEDVDELDDKRSCFVIMPISTRAEDAALYGDTDHFLHVLDHLITPALEAAAFRVLSPVAEGSDLIQHEVIKNLCEADLVLCDMSGLNANVFFEWGIRTALNKPVCVTADSLTANVPFDVGLLNYHQYNPALTPWSLLEQVPLLTAHVLRTFQKSGDGTNTLWQRLGVNAVASSAGQPEDWLASKVAALEGHVEELRSRKTRDAGGPVTTESRAISPAEARDMVVEVLRPGVIVELEQLGDTQEIRLVLLRPNASEEAALARRAGRLRELGWTVRASVKRADAGFTFTHLDEV